MAKESIDIEALLIWAYRAQCVHRNVGLARKAMSVGPAPNPSGNLGQVLALGTRVDNSGPGLKALGVKVQDDALTVHDAVLGLSEVFLEWCGPDEVVVWNEALAARAGLVIEERRGVGAVLLPQVWRGTREPAPVRLERAGIAVQVIVMAQSGNRPETYPGWVFTPGARPADAAAMDRRGRPRQTEGRVSDREVMHARAIYRAWHMALALLAETLAGNLARFAVSGPAAPVAPWEMTGRVLQISPDCQIDYVSKTLNSVGNKSLLTVHPLDA